MKKAILILLLCSASLYAVRVPLTSFNTGEISPYLQVRTDFTKYKSACKTLYNMIPLSQGPVVRRPGTEFIAETGTMTDRSRLIPFEYSTTDAYILEFADLSMRVYRDGGQVITLTGTSTIPASLTTYQIAQWTMDDNAASTKVTDSAGSPTHHGTCTVNTSTISVTGEISTALDMQGTHTITISDHDDFFFDDSADEGFSIAAWVYAIAGSRRNVIVAKWDNDSSVREWMFYMNSYECLAFDLFDETNKKFQYARDYGKGRTLSGWNFVVLTYDGRGGATAHDGINIYLNNEIIPDDAEFIKGGESSYVQLRNTQASVTIGSSNSAPSIYYWEGYLDNIAIFNTALDASDINTLFAATSTYQLTTTYNEDEVSEIQYVQLADTMYLAHPDHHPRKLTRAGHTDWTIADVDYTDGPFIDENASPTYTIAPSALTGAITLTASTNTFSAGDVGALVELRHPRLDAVQSGSFTTNRSTAAIDCEGDYKLTTHGTWSGTVDIERSNDSGTTWERVPRGRVNSVDDDNASVTGTESESGYQYRLTSSGWVSGTCTYDFLVYDHLHTGVARINGYTSPTVVSATVTTTMGSTTATNYWSQGYFSPKNGYPRSIAFHEFRMWYGGSAKYPQTIWSTKTDDYEKMDDGDGDDDDALTYILPNQNPIQWMLSHTYLMIGTLGGAGRLGEQDEEMTPTSRPQYIQQARFGSEYMQAILAGDAILYAEKGGTKIREFVYNLERDKFLAPDMTILAEHITGDGIVDMAFQSRPESILWCVREDGDLLSMTYNREQEVIAWARHILGGSGDVESVVIIPGSEEDEIWLVVERTINSATKRYIERMKPRDWGTSDTDVFYVDSGLTWDGGDTVNITGATQASPCVITVSVWPTDGDGNSLEDGDQIKIESVVGMTELNGNIYTMDDASVASFTFSLNNSADTQNVSAASYTAYTSGGTAQGYERGFSGYSHLEGETIAICVDGVADANETVASGTFTADTWSNKMHAGLAFTSTLETMPISFAWQDGETIALSKDIREININFYKTMGTKYGVSGDLEDIPFGQTTLFTDWIDLSFQYGHRRDASVYLQQTDPLPMCVRAVVFNVEANR